MRSFKFGVREVVALSLFAVAIIGGLAVTFLRGDDTQTRAAAELASERSGTPTGDATRAPTPPAPTPLRDVSVKQPNGWIVTYYSLDADGGERFEGKGTVEKLDLKYDQGGPFPDLKDNSWSVRAEASLQGDPGQWKFTIEYQGDVRVLFEGAEVAKSSSARPAKLDVSLPTTQGAGTVTVEGRDSVGPFLLKWP